MTKESERSPVTTERGEPANAVTSMTDNDDAAFRRAWDDHHGELLGYLVHALGDRQLAEDARQEVYLRAWRSWDRYDGSRASVRTWLYAITRNHVIDRHRRRRLNLVSDPEGRAAALPAEQDHDPADVIADRALVATLLATLDPLDARALVALVIEGRTSVELGRELGMPDSTVRSRAARALVRLRQHLDDTRALDLHTKGPS